MDEVTVRKNKKGVADMENPHISDISPFSLCDNLYFVGSTKVSVHLIQTECGLVMIDTGYPDMFEQIVHSMAELQLEPKDICAIFHSHGHIDHFGCTKAFQKISGAKTYISRIDNEIVNGTYDLSWAKELGLERLPPFDCDVLVEDGEVFSFGSVNIRCRLTPGHSDGVLSFFLNLTDAKKPITAAMHGGVGMNSFTKEFLDSYGLSFRCREIFRKGLQELAKESVDLVLGNHPQQNDTAGKLQKRLHGEQSVIDPTEWNRFLKECEQNLDHLIKSEQA